MSTTSSLSTIIGGSSSIYYTIISSHCNIDTFGVNTIESDQWTDDNFKQLVDDLQQLHLAGFIHCDIRPPNLLLHNGKINIVDLDSLNYENITFNIYLFFVLLQQPHFRSPDIFGQNLGCWGGVEPIIWICRYPSIRPPPHKTSCTCP